ncbi:hypothetical protein [Photorhabdus khanii]|uniref:hypothetical protein n=1 Tax=Photorhabdus khanii TaxID=1004150 RepID=UPI001864C8C9|nr:hypothetical protein [Photorhabdus khanii]
MAALSAFSGFFIDTLRFGWSREKTGFLPPDRVFAFRLDIQPCGLFSLITH